MARTRRRATPTAVGVDELGVHEAHFEIVQHGWLVEVAECREVVLAHQDVRVSQVRQVLCLGVQGVLKTLEIKHTHFSYRFLSDRPSIHRVAACPPGQTRTCKCSSEKLLASRRPTSTVTIATSASANDGTQTRWSKSELRKPGSSSLVSQFDKGAAHRSILQQQLQGGVSILVVLGQLSRLPHLLRIRDPHPSGLMNTERTGNTKVKLGSGFRVGVRVAVVRRAPRSS